MKNNELLIAASLGVLGILVPGILINYFTNNVAINAVIFGVLTSSMVGYFFGCYETIQEYKSRKPKEPCDSNGNPMPICKSCEVDYPNPHDFDCPEAQE